MSATVAHTLIFVVLVTAYVVLTVTGHDGNIIWGLLGGQAVGASAQKLASA